MLSVVSFKTPAILVYSGILLPTTSAMSVFFWLVYIYIPIPSDLSCLYCYAIFLSCKLKGRRAAILYIWFRYQQRVVYYTRSFDGLVPAPVLELVTNQKGIKKEGQSAVTSGSAPAVRCSPFINIWGTGDNLFVSSVVFYSWYILSTLAPVFLFDLL